MKAIKLLSPVLANQLAAGEVIERPASVLKELLENAIDAQASVIAIECRQAGMEKIWVRDNGHGIPPEELGLALTRHATSKVDCFDDLLSLRTLGFRGEALASMASVSRFSLSSAIQGALCGFRLGPGDHLSLEGGAIELALEKIAHPLGTTVEVCDLFYNVPVRRKFMKGWRTEQGHLIDVVQKMALSHPQIRFSFSDESRKKVDWPAVGPAGWLERLAQIWGPAWAERAIFFEEEAVDLHIWGYWIPLRRGDPMTVRQYSFVNNRCVRDKTIQYAIRMGCLEEPGSLILFMRLDPARLDVNVHPTKHELRFHEPTIVHQMIVSVLQKTLQLQQKQQPSLEAMAYQENTNQESVMRAHQGGLQTPRFLPYKQYALFYGAKQDRLSILRLRSLAQYCVQAIVQGYRDPLWGEWEPTLLPFPQICSLEEEKNDFLETAAGLSCLQAMACSGRRIGQRQWALEACPLVLQGLNLIDFFQKTLHPLYLEWVDALKKGRSWPDHQGLIRSPLFMQSLLAEISADLWSILDPLVLEEKIQSLLDQIPPDQTERYCVFLGEKEIESFFS